MTLVNCKGLRTVTGIGALPLQDLRLIGTGLDLEGLLQSGLPKTLSSGAFITGKAWLDRQLEERLAALGIKPFP
jgi:hypothetical protein